MLGALLSLALTQAGPRVDWPALIQKPYATATIPDPGLHPLLEMDGQKIATPDGWHTARRRLEEAWQARLGKPPAKPDQLDVRIESEQKLDGYTRTLVSFQSEGDDRIRAYLLVPSGLKPGDKRSAVVVFHQTSRETLREPVGLGTKPELALALHLVRRGHVTLSPECFILKDPLGWAKGQAAALDKRRPGWTGMGKMTFDASRCVDYLESLPLVDAKRIGCIGHSLGAKEVLYAMAFEPRYRVGVFSEGGIGLRMSNWTDSWYLTDRIKGHWQTLEHHQVLALAAPRPMLLLGGDSADGDASWAFIQAVLPVYRLLGASEHVGLINHKAGHRLPREAQDIAYRWLEYWLR
jgi:dienelactone hydrolase